MPKHRSKSQLIASTFVLFIVITGFITALTYYVLFEAEWLMLSALLAINMASFIWMGLDKGKAGWERARVPELFFYLVALLGGAGGILVGVRFFHHKTQKNTFLAMVGLIVLIQVLGSALFILTK